METIRCPKCNYEYSPSEIFLPNYFLGRSEKIKRDGDGNIIEERGIIQNTNETYCCDNCNTLFAVKTKIDYSVEVIVE